MITPRESRFSISWTRFRMSFLYLRKKQEGIITAELVTTSTSQPQGLISLGHWVAFWTLLSISLVDMVDCISFEGFLENPWMNLVTEMILCEVSYPMKRNVASRLQRGATDWKLPDRSYESYLSTFPRRIRFRLGIDQISWPCAPAPAILRLLRPTPVPYVRRCRLLDDQLACELFQPLDSTIQKKESSLILSHQHGYLIYTVPYKTSSREVLQ